VRRLAYEAADCGLLSPDLAAGIRRVKGVKDDRREARKLAHRRTVAKPRCRHPLHSDPGELTTAIII